MALQHLRSSTANKRPDPASMSDGQLAINTNLASPGVFFKDSNGDLVKAGPVHVGSTAPNATPASGGTAGNSTGELWLDTSLTPNELKTWNGSAWVSATGQEIPVSKLIDGSARQLLQTDAAGTGVEWTSNVDVPGTLDVTGIATFDERIRTILGSASTPAITAASDTNTGIFFSGADVVNIASNSSTVVAIEKDNATADVQVTGKLRSTNTATSSAFIPTGTTVPTNGIYLPDANTVGISTNGTGRLFVDSSGNVGAGTANPNHKLTLEQAGTTTFDAYNIRNGATSSVGYGVGLTGTGEVFHWNTTNAAMYFATNNTERLRITSDGRVGLGTSSVSNTLDIRATGANIGVRSTTSGQNQYIFFSNTADSTNGLISQTGSELRIQQQDNVSGSRITFYTKDSERVRIDDQGRVGVGATPSAKLHVNTGTNENLWVGSLGGSGAGVYLASVNDSGSANTPIQIGSASVINFAINGTEAARIDSSRRLLVGTASMTAHVRAAFRGNSFGAGVNATVYMMRDAANPTTGQTLGVFAFSDSNEGIGAEIAAQSDGTWGTNDYPGRLVFSVTRDSQASPSEALRISNTGAILSSSDQSVRQLDVTNTNASYAQDLVFARSSRAANSAYTFFVGQSNGGSDNEFILRGDGNAYADGTWGSPADYAEMFEWSDGNENQEDRRGIAVVLDGNKIRIATEGEDPIGVISGHPMIVGDSAWNRWSEKYLKDEYNCPILEDYEVTDQDGNAVIQQRRKLNPAYDPDMEYIPREERPEWDCVGLMGKLRIRKGQVTGSRWIKMRDISDSVEEWLVR